MKILKAKTKIKIRFSEVDAMRVVWHGDYAKYFEDARECFGEKYGLDYDTIVSNGYYVPIVDMTIKYRKPLRYGMLPEITIVYRPSDAAKIVFDYEIHDSADGSLIATGHTVQVFMGLDYGLVWFNPDFYKQWKNKWQIE